MADDPSYQTTPKSNPTPTTKTAPGTTAAGSSKTATLLASQGLTGGTPEEQWRALVPRDNTVTPRDGLTPIDIPQKSNALLLESGKDIPAYHVILEQLAHKFAYHDKYLNGDAYPGHEARVVLDMLAARGKPVTERINGMEVPARSREDMQKGELAALGYRRDKVVQDDTTGFEATLFVPEPKYPGQKEGTRATLPDGTVLAPVVAFRGTDAGGPGRDVADDTNPLGIGAWQFTMHQEDVRGLLGAAKGKGMGLPDVTGHSLGGALAQRCAAAFGGLVRDVVTFQSPSIDAGTAAQVDPKQHRSTHYKMWGDVVSAAGQAMTPGREMVFARDCTNHPGVHTDFPLRDLNAARNQAGGKGLSGIPGGDPLAMAGVVERDHAGPLNTAFVSNQTAEANRIGTSALTGGSELVLPVLLWQKLAVEIEGAVRDGRSWETVAKAIDQVIGLDGSPLGIDKVSAKRVWTQAKQLYDRLAAEAG